MSSSDESLSTSPALPRRSFLSRELTLTWEATAWLALLAAALLTRFWDLGARVMSHDESLHVFYSWWLASGSGYAHNPMMHGPFLFEATALFNRVFGASDFVSRLVPALMGIVITVLVPFLYRRWLGRYGALAAGVFFLISPYVLYYTRYNRHDPQVITWVLLAVWAMLTYISDRQDRHLYYLAGFMGLMLATMETSFIYLAILALYLIGRLLAKHGPHWQALRAAAEFDLLIVVGTLGAFFSSPILLPILNPIWTASSGKPFVDLAVLNTFGIEWSTGEYGSHLWTLLAVFAIAGTAIGVWWDWRRWLQLAAVFLSITIVLFTTFFTNFLPGIGTGFIGSLGYWLSQQDVQRGSQPVYYYFLVFPLYEYMPILLGLLSALLLTLRYRVLDPAVRRFGVLAAWWAVAIFAGLSVAGEKMPWLSTHLTVPFILLAAWGVERLAQLVLRGDDDVDDVDQEEGALQKFNAARVWGKAGLALVGVLTVLTVRTSYMVNYVNYDYTTEFVGYAHGAPGVKETMQDIDAIAAQTGLGKGMKVASDDEIAWPMSWYLRDYTGFFGANISRDSAVDAPVVVVGPKNWKKADQYLGKDYHRYEVIRMWWPMEDYKDLTWERIRFALTDPAMRAAVWQIVWNRDYTAYAELTGQNKPGQKPVFDPPREWSLQDRMRVYIRKDIAAQMPDLALASAQIEDVVPPVDAYTGVHVELEPLAVLQPAGLLGPRGVTVGPDGSVYVADTGNHRVIKLSPAGEQLLVWGSRSPDGQVPPPPATFNEPWGLGVDLDGNVYVADTWNHRIQKFDADGNFLLEWGVGGLIVDGADRFWGPRAVAVGADGRVYVTDTGNKRVAVFDPAGQHLFDFDTSGSDPLDEPVGLAVSPEGFIYVADTWNMRVAIFSADGQFISSWPVTAWDSDSIDNKPYIAISPTGSVYLTDPESYRVLNFSADGTPLAAFGELGNDARSFEMPNGIAVGPDGSVYVADAVNNRVAVYPGQ